MTEATLWRVVRERLSPYGRLTSTKRLGDDVPDAAYTLRYGAAVRAASGWLELKHSPTVPAPDRPLRFGHPPTLGQVMWQEEEEEAGGRAWTLAQVGTLYLLLRPATLRLVHRETPSRVVLDAATTIGVDGFPTRRLLAELTR